MSKVVKRNKIGEKLHYYRKEKGLTQQEIADKIGITRNAYAYYETKCEPSIETLNKILEIFEIPFSKFMGETSVTTYSVQTERRFPPLIFSDHKAKGYQINPESNIDYNDFFSEDELTLVALFRGLSDESKKNVLEHLRSENKSNE